MQEFQCQSLVDLRGVIPVAFEVAPHHGFEAFPIEPWPGQCSLVEQNLLNITSKSVPIPDAEMEDFVIAEEEPVEVQG